MIHLLVFFSGLAALSWQVVWQLKTALALGVSAWGTALTLAVTMAGLCFGSLWAGAWLKRQQQANPLRIYGLLEFIIGAAGLLLTPAFIYIEHIDSSVYHAMPLAAPIVHVLSLAAALGVATLAMGATLPVFGLLARQSHTSLSVLYGLNTLGAAFGAIICAFSFIPLFGVELTIQFVAGLNILIALLCLLLAKDKRVEVAAPAPLQPLNARLWAIAAITGFATFVLEVSWFRSLTAAFGSTTDAFAIMLAAVLLALGLGARLVPLVRRLRLSPAHMLASAGIAVLLATPFIERFDIVTSQIYSDYPLLVLLFSFGMSLVFLGIPMLLLGSVLPRLMDEQNTPQDWSRLYALNSLCGVAGSLAAGWLLLPTIGFVAAAWLAGSLIALSGIILLQGRVRQVFALFAVAALVLAVTTHSGAGRSRAQINIASQRLAGAQVLASYNGPDVTTSAVEFASGIRALIIDGTLATAQPGGTDKLDPAHYMPWMGHLPMLVHESPQQALVICFGTGQTAHAVRVEAPQQLDIVDINPHVFDLAQYFTANNNVLGDARVHPIVMDGRAYLRRVPKLYDVITLEPMPPTHAGVNALYSAEFYELARARLTQKGVIAQWVPFHLLTPYHAAAITRTFQSVFPNSILWIDPLSTTGILLGSMDEAVKLGEVLPGYARQGIVRDMTEADVRKAILLDRSGLERLGAYSEVITDDNQLLAYGSAVHPSRRGYATQSESYEFVLSVAAGTR